MQARLLSYTLRAKLIGCRLFTDKALQLLQRQSQGLQLHLLLIWHHKHLLALSWHDATGGDKAMSEGSRRAFSCWNALGGIQAGPAGHPIASSELHSSKLVLFCLTLLTLFWHELKWHLFCVQQSYLQQEGVESCFLHSASCREVKALELRLKFMFVGMAGKFELERSKDAVANSKDAGQLPAGIPERVCWSECSRDWRAYWGALFHFGDFHNGECFQSLQCKYMMLRIFEIAVRSLQRESLWKRLSHHHLATKSSLNSGSQVNNWRIISVIIDNRAHHQHAKAA